MINKIIATVVFTAAAALPLVANAGEVYNREVREQARINQGVASGQLTAREYAQVEGRLDRINASRAWDLRHDDGHGLTPWQYRNLNARENGLSNQIYFDKHNLRHQPGAPTI